MRRLVFSNRPASAICWKGIVNVTGTSASAPSTLASDGVGAGVGSGVGSCSGSRVGSWSCRCAPSGVGVGSDGSVTGSGCSPLPATKRCAVTDRRGVTTGNTSSVADGVGVGVSAGSGVGVTAGSAPASPATTFTTAVNTAFSWSSPAMLPAASVDTTFEMRTSESYP